MASEQELIDSVNALPDTQAFFASAGAVTELPAGHGVIKTYTHIKNVDDNRVRQDNVRIYVNASEEAFFLGSDPVPDARPEPRVKNAQVLSFYPNAENINISRLDESFDEVRFDDYDNATKKAVKRLVRVKFDGASYEKHYEVTNEYEQVA